MLVIGSHVSFKGDTQLLGAVEETLSYGANAFMFYTGAPQNVQRSPINAECTYAAYKLMQEHNIALENVVCHAPYIINLANDLDIDKYNFAQRFLSQELSRCAALGVRKIVLHPGSALKIPRKQALDNIIMALNNVLTSEYDVTILLETMAGKGSECGINIDELQYIIDHINDKNHIGVCLDTCHLNDSGVDLTQWDNYLSEFATKIGLQYIGCIHVNDSKNVLGSHKDRHENIGYGTIGFNTLLAIIYDERLKNIPKILETPYVDRLYPPYKWEIAMIRDKQFNENLYIDIINYYKNI